MANYHPVVKAEKTGDREVTFTFDGPGHHTLPQIIGQLTVFPKAWWQGTDKDGKARDIGSTTLEPPLGSGPYRIKEFQPGRSIVYERVPDLGERAQRQSRHQQFRRAALDYFRDATVAIEAFKAGAVDWRVENSAKNWATAYDFPAVSDKRVILEEFSHQQCRHDAGLHLQSAAVEISGPAACGWLSIMRSISRSMNKEIFFGQYKRTLKLFRRHRSRGQRPAPSAAEDRAARDRFAIKFRPKYSGKPTPIRSAAIRQRCETICARRCDCSRRQARDPRSSSSPTSRPASLSPSSFLSNHPLFERVFLFYKPSLEQLGIEVTVRTVDEAQYENRLRNWDFDIIIYAWGKIRCCPATSCATTGTRPAADQPGSENIGGIKNPAVDAMIDRVVSAKNRADLVTAARALDRILLWNHYVVPQWNYSKLRTARWDRFSHPEPMPKYGIAAFPTVWWWDADKAAKVGSRS